MNIFRREHATWHIRFLATCFLWLLVSSSFAQSAPANRDQVRQLLNLIDQRLAVAPLVARAKWNSGGAIDDPAREQAILEAVSKQAEDAGLDAAFARRFFQAQFDAGKMIQRDLHRQWQANSQGKFADAPDLGRDVRPVLDRLTPQLIASLRTLYPQLHQPETRNVIQSEAATTFKGDINATVRDCALRPFLED
jgi:chorismate mutase